MTIEEDFQKSVDAVRNAIEARFQVARKEAEQLMNAAFEDIRQLSLQSGLPVRLTLSDGDYDGHNYTIRPRGHVDYDEWLYMHMTGNVHPDHDALDQGWSVSAVC